MRISGAWIGEPGTRSLFAALEYAGFKAFFVGGCVRNALLAMPVSDIDVATDAAPEKVIALAERAGLRVIPTGIEHGTVTVIAGGISHEVTTFRRDEKTDGRHAVVAFSTDLNDDAARRDFTMNALYADASGQVLDPIGGLQDLQSGHVRFVGDPHAHISEDYLRILRFFRFTAVYGNPVTGIDAEGLAACAENAAGLARISPERVGMEFRKLLAAQDPAPAMAAMAQSGVLAQVLPGADTKALAPLVHLDSTSPPRWQRRLAVLGGADATDALRLSRSESRALQLVSGAIGGGLSAAALGSTMGEVLASDVVLCRAALLESPLGADYRAEVARGAAAKFPVLSGDLMPGLQGSALGARLKALHARWLASDLRLSRSELLA